MLGARSTSTIRREITADMAGDLKSVLDKAMHLGRGVGSGVGDKSKSRTGTKTLLGPPLSPAKKDSGGITVSVELMGILKTFASKSLAVGE